MVENKSKENCCTTSKCCMPRLATNKSNQVVDIGFPENDEAPWAEVPAIAPLPIYYTQENFKPLEASEKEALLKNLTPVEKDGTEVYWVMKEKRDAYVEKLLQDDDTFRSPAEIIFKYGYPFERFFIDTKDDYML